MDKHEKQALLHTLELAGIRPSGTLNGIKVLAFSRRDSAENKEVRGITNRLLLDLLRTSDLGVCIHVTGEMRALTDPFHRQICEEMRRREETGFNVLYHIPRGRLNNAASLVAWNLSRWSKGRPRNWQEELRTIDVIARRSVDLFAYNALNVIQYSVFGHRYVLLQEKHEDRAESKRIWLLESERINERLAERGRALLAEATAIDEGLFHEFAANVSGVAARRYLRRLQDSSLEGERLRADRFVRDHVDKPQDVIDALNVVGFVRQDPVDRISITSAGREFLGFF